MHFCLVMLKKSFSPIFQYKLGFSEIPPLQKMKKTYRVLFALGNIPNHKIYVPRITKNHINFWNGGAWKAYLAPRLMSYCYTASIFKAISIFKIQYYVENFSRKDQFSTVGQYVLLPSFCLIQSLNLTIGNTKRRDLLSNKFLQKIYIQLTLFSTVRISTFPSTSYRQRIVVEGRPAGLPPVER